MTCPLTNHQGFGYTFSQPTVFNLLLVGRKKLLGQDNRLEKLLCKRSFGLLKLWRENKAEFWNQLSSASLKINMVMSNWTSGALIGFIIFDRILRSALHIYFCFLAPTWHSSHFFFFPDSEAIVKEAQGRFQIFPAAFQDIWCWLEGLSSCGATAIRGEGGREKERKYFQGSIQNHQGLWGKLRGSSAH